MEKGKRGGGKGKDFLEYIFEANPGRPLLSFAQERRDLPK